MVLTYFKEPNFGDAINPIIFNGLLPGFFDQDEKSVFLGIGSILGLFHARPNTRKIVVYSSGYAYGDLPTLDSRYDIRCVRGPLTARALGLSPKLAVTDGAILLPLLQDFMGPVKKKYPFSFIPHHVSELMFNEWDDLLPQLGIHLIHPGSNALEVIHQIRQSECVLVEAMHGAIIADCFRIPWIPVKMYQHINAFKWKDWALSMELKYQPETLTSLFSEKKIRDILSEKYLQFDKSKKVAHSLSPFYKLYQDLYKKKKFIRQMQEIIKKEPFLSEQPVFQSRMDQLWELLVGIRDDYGQGIMKAPAQDA